MPHLGLRFSIDAAKMSRRLGPPLQLGEAGRLPGASRRSAAGWGEQPVVAAAPSSAVGLDAFATRVFSQSWKETDL